MILVTATEIKNNFGKYIKMLEDEGEIVITQYGKEVARLVSKDAVHKSLLEDYRGIIKHHYDLDEIKEERANRYYEDEDDD